MTDRRLTAIVAAAFAALLVACASQLAAPPVAEMSAPADLPAVYYQRLSAQGASVFRVDPIRSLVLIEVRRSGPLAQFGHDHVIASHDVAGYIAPDEGRADLYVPLDALTVDEPALRSERGLDTQPSPADIAGTRSNMLQKVLETDLYPFARVSVNPRASGGDSQDLTVAVTLHGTTRTVVAAVQTERSNEEVWVTGTIAIDQSQFGIAPFSILGGAIAVQDRVTITYRIIARRM